LHVPFDLFLRTCHTLSTKKTGTGPVTLDVEFECWLPVIGHFRHRDGCAAFGIDDCAHLERVAVHANYCLIIEGGWLPNVEEFIDFPTGVLHKLVKHPVGFSTNEGFRSDIPLFRCGFTD